MPSKTYEYTVHTQIELKQLLSKIAAKDRGAYVEVVDVTTFPATVKSNVKVQWD